MFPAHFITFAPLLTSTFQRTAALWPPSPASPRQTAAWPSPASAQSILGRNWPVRSFTRRGGSVTSTSLSTCKFNHRCDCPRGAALQVSCEPHGCDVSVPADWISRATQRRRRRCRTERPRGSSTIWEREIPAAAPGTEIDTQAAGYQRIISVFTAEEL